jgi:transposase
MLHGSHKTRRALRADRLRVAALAVAGTSTADIARQLRLDRRFVTRWRQRISKVGSINDADRSGRPRTRTAVVVKRVRVKLCGKTRKSTRAVAAELTAAGTRVSQMYRRAGRPRRRVDAASPRQKTLAHCSGQGQAVEFRASAYQHGLAPRVVR